jgi:dipeptidyl aminopeptidase/acylaminoacyl peptidase
VTQTRLRPSDLYKITTILSPTVSPDDKFVAAVSKRACHKTERSYESMIRVFALPGGEPHSEEIGLAGVCNHSPRWAPDSSRIAFLSPVHGVDQLWIHDLRDESLTQISEVPEGIVQFDWAPDGKRAVLAARVCDPSNKNSVEDLQMITTIREKVRSQRTWAKQESVSCQLLVVDLESGNSKQITEGPWDSIQPTWSPISDEIAFVSNRDNDPDPMIRTDIWLIDFRGEGLRRLTRGTGPFGNPCWAPNGEKLAAIGYERDEHPTYQTFNRVWELDRSGGTMRCLTGELDATCSNCSISDLREFGGHGPGAISWPKGHGLIYFLAGLRGTTQLMAVAPVDNTISQCTSGNHEVYAFAPLHKTRDVVTAKSTPTVPGDLWWQRGEKQERRLTCVNSWLEGVALTELEPLEVINTEGQILDGWIMKPIDFDSDRQYPAIMQVHRIMFAATFLFECQLMAASGFVVFYMNQHGSLGYGQSFALADWTDTEISDLLAGASQLGRLPFVDDNIIGICGGSNGGYLTYRLLAEGDIFAAGVGQRGMTNFASFFGSSDMAYHWTNWILPGYPWTHPEAYREISPISSVDKIDAPLLIIHSDRDTRVPIEQAEQLFIALKCLKRPVTFARFKSEGHNLSRSGQPVNRIARLELILDWFKQHLM